MVCPFVQRLNQGLSNGSIDEEKSRSAVAEFSDFIQSVAQSAKDIYSKTFKKFSGLIQS